jgi:hypothetical protein
MKLFIYLYAALVFTFIGACSKDIENATDNVPSLMPEKTDANAGNWKPILLTAPDEFPLAAPGVTATPDYIAQLSEIKSWQAQITAEEKASVKYWSAGAVLRWNELLRELVAKHNVPPYQNADGTYPAPSAANPLAYPTFPFSNPPYAARAYAYVTAAQYDALVAAWHYKFLYNRSAPYKYDSSVKTLVPVSDIPSYPSEDAVVAGVMSEMMKLLFPGDQDYIQQKIESHIHARLIAGANVRSDMDAGLALGKSVAQKFVAKARTDKAGVAGGTPADWAKFETDCISRGETPWISLEVPKRPCMLPLFGNVRSIHIDSATMVSLIPGPPPSVNSDQMNKELQEVYDNVTDISRDHIKIVHFWADGVNTATPPGHWNAIAAGDFIKRNFSEVRWARNLALLNISMMDAAIVCWATKTKYYNPRPSQLNPEIKTMTGVPNFPSYISGHSTFSGAAATVLGYIIPERKTDYEAMAAEASLSRLYGGIHYRSDCETGLVVGKNVGDISVSRGMNDGAN